MKYHLITLGCQMNLSDSERVRTVVDRLGYNWTDHEDEAGRLGIVACSVRQNAIDKVYSRIHKWNRMKDKRNLVTFITGCILPNDKERFLKLSDIVFPVSELNELPSLLGSYGVVTPAALRSMATGMQLNRSISEFWHSAHTTVHLSKLSFPSRMGATRSAPSGGAREPDQESCEQD